MIGPAKKLSGHNPDIKPHKNGSSQTLPIQPDGTYANALNSPNPCVQGIELKVHFLLKRFPRLSGATIHPVFS